MARIVLGITGGIAAYKTPQLVRDLIAAGHEVRVVMTASAGHFVSALSLATVSQNPVRNALFELDQEAQIGHIELARWPDIVLVAPATADLIARCAQGRCDDLLTTILLATRARIVVAPAMNVQMWAHSATQHNVSTLVQRGVQVVAPARGVLACGEEGEGKMADLQDIVQAVGQPQVQDWSNRRVLVTAGPTREALDAVRFISNPSTGTMGYALAAAAASRGAKVDLVSGPVHLQTPAGVTRHDVVTGEEMYSCARALLSSTQTDWVFKVAAVADLCLPGDVSEKKSKAQWLASSWSFSSTRDVLASLVPEFPKTRFLGFAAQTAKGQGAGEISQAILEKAKAKLVNKGCDAIFVNQVGVAGSGFGPGTNGGYLVKSSKTKSEVQAIAQDKPVEKTELAHRILDALLQQESA